MEKWCAEHTEEECNAYYQRIKQIQDELGSVYSALLEVSYNGNK